MPQDTTQYLKDYKAPAYTITDISLVFDLDPTATKVTAVSKVITVDANQPLILDGDDIKLLSVSVNNQTLTSDQYQIDNSQLVLNDLPSEFELTVVTQLNPSENSNLEGLYLADGAFCTQCEAQGFRRITYYLDRPDVMAVFTTKIIADKSQFPYLLSNGNKTDSGDLADNKHFAIWSDPFKKPAYLFALVAGDFDLLAGEFITKSNKTVALEFFVDKGNKHKATYALESLQRAMKWDEERFGLEYDLDIYMVVAVDFFNMGAMENKGLNVFNSKFVLADNDSATDKDFHGIEAVIGHEYFHNWTGNRITCRDWFQLSLKEGLTVFRDQEFSSDLGSRAVNRIDAVKIIRSHQFSEDASPMAHPIRPQAVMEMNNFYTVTVYNKGSEVIRMIHTLLGEEKFQAGMKQYIHDYDGMAVTCDDFIAAMQTGSGFDLTQFKYWYEQSSTPIVAVDTTFNEATNQMTLSFTQKHTGLDGVNALQIPMNIEFIDVNGDVYQGDNAPQTLVLDEAKQQFTFDNISSDVTPVFMGDFSAPIKLEFANSTDKLIHTLKYSSNDYSRWDSAQQLFTQVILDNSTRVVNDMNVDDALIDAVALVLNNENLDPALIALMLELPSNMALFELVDLIDVDGLLSAKTLLKQQIAIRCAVPLMKRHQQCINQLLNSDSAQAVGLRSLKQSLGLYICADMAENKEINDIISSQFDNANEMTDSINALTLAGVNQLACFDNLSEQFINRWTDNGLVMDKWFMVIGQSPQDDAIDRVNKAMKQPCFSWQNPNRVRSLIGGFSQGNTKQFHAIDGSGYEFLTDQLVRLNSINPQIAARLITPLLSWNKYDGVRAQLMKEQLIRLTTINDLSKDLHEKLTLSLSK